MKKNILISILFTMLPSLAFLQIVKLDTTFGPQGMGYTNLFNTQGLIHNMDVMPDQRILLCGFLRLPSDDLGIQLERLTSSGLPDSSFGIEGITVLTPFDFTNDGFTRKMMTLSDGKIMIGVYVVTSPSLNNGFLLMRLNEDGTPDSTFSGIGYRLYIFENQGFFGISFTADELGNTYVTGILNQNQALQKLNLHGDPDITFGNQGVVVIPTFQDSAWSELGQEIIIEPNGKLLTVAAVLKMGAFKGFVTSRLFPDGSPDHSFGDNGSSFVHSGIYDARTCSIHLQTDGKILYKDYPFSDRIHLFRLDEQGQPDLTFGQNGSVYLDSLIGPFSREGLLINPNGTILMPYTESRNGNRHNYLQQFHSDFSIDPLFGDDGRFELPSEIQGYRFISILFHEDAKVLLNMFSVDPFPHNVLVRLEEITVNVKEIFAVDHPITVYPNPTSDKINIHFSLTEDTQMTFQLVDLQGRPITKYLQKEIFISGDHDYSLKLPGGLCSGIYMVRLITKTSQKSIPFTVLK